MVGVRRIGADDWKLLRETRIAALADAPGDATTTVARAVARDDRHWQDSAAANASGPLQATFFAVDPAPDGEVVGMVGAYANQDGTVNLVGLWSAPGHRDVGVADALLEAASDWARESGATRLRIWVVERNEHARQYYERQGFEATGNSMPYEPEPRISQLEMIRKL
jgi:GNAT superfamily N-acetyltransferase